MRVRVAFTVDIDDKDEASMDNMRELAQADDVAGIRTFIKGDAEDYVIQYLSDNGIRCKATGVEPYVSGT